MSTRTSICAVAIGCIVLVDVVRRYINNQKQKRSLPLPPGPPGLPFIGNVIGIDVNAPWLTYADWAKTYGDLVYTRFLGKDIIVINSESVARELLDGRSINYSDRPYFSTSKLCGLDFFTALMAYGDTWRLQRRFFHQTFRPEVVNRFVSYQDRQACQLMRRILESPENPTDHVSVYTTSIILKSVYDYDLVSMEDEVASTICKVLEIVVPALRPELVFVVGAFPAIMKLPSWLPGMSLKEEMRLAKEHAKNYVQKPFKYSVQRMENGLAPSMVHDSLSMAEEKGAFPDNTWLDVLKQASGSAYLGGAETSQSAIKSFLLMMVVNPAVQEVAQAQIDAVVGNCRLPSIQDRPSLPYIDAIMRETLRIHPLGPLSVPHAAVSDDVYRGYHIPKGAIIFPNLWSMAHDESKYPNPHEYMPQRWLNNDGSLKPDTSENFTFGFGRRICPGRHFADTALWLVFAKVLAVFKILNALDENGVEIPVEPKYSSGLAIHPLPFPFRIVPRIAGMDAATLEEMILASTV